MSDIVISDAPGEGTVTLRSTGVRKCNGCAKCLTDHPGVCDLCDDFTSLIGQILDVDTLTFMVQFRDGRIPSDIAKAIERLSNVLDSYTDVGGNVPLPITMTRLRVVRFVVFGEADRAAFEASMRANLQKGPVESVVFAYE